MATVYLFTFVFFLLLHTTIFAATPYVSQCDTSTATVSTATIATTVATTSGVQYGTITGVLRDEQGEPIVGAAALVEGTRRGTYSKMYGKLTIVKLLPGTYTLRVYSIGFIDGKTTATVQAGSTEECTITLQSDGKPERDAPILRCPRLMIDHAAIGIIRQITGEELQRAP